MYLHGRDFRSCVEVEVIRVVTAVFLRATAADLIEAGVVLDDRICLLGDSFSTKPGPTDWKRAANVLGLKNLFFNIVLFYLCFRLKTRYKHLSDHSLVGSIVSVRYSFIYKIVFCWVVRHTFWMYYYLSYFWNKHWNRHR